MFDQLLYRTRTMLRGLRVRCPNCGVGIIFNGLFKFNPTCPQCGVRYERLSGESIGSVYINLAVTEVIAVFGFFLIEVLTDIPMMHQLIFWVPFNLIFPVLFYRHTRGLWIAITHLAVGLTPDSDLDREWHANR